MWKVGVEYTALEFENAKLDMIICMPWASQVSENLAPNPCCNTLGHLVKLKASFVTAFLEVLRRNGNVVLVDARDELQVLVVLVIDVSRTDFKLIRHYLPRSMERLYVRLVDNVPNKMDREVEISSLDVLIVRAVEGASHLLRDVQHSLGAKRALRHDEHGHGDDIAALVVARSCPHVSGTRGNGTLGHFHFDQLINATMNVPAAIKTPQDNRSLVL